jgi:2-keto-4-pentenoate hydratase/2-oxohepta-3-ene-1,7-dioic acid hydratase in catechol pathway
MFSDHIAELGNQRPSKPFYFLKPPSSIYPRPKAGWTRAKDEIRIPHGMNVHYEIELGLVMRNRLLNLGYSKRTLSTEEYEKKWLDAIYGYIIGNTRLQLIDNRN